MIEIYIAMQICYVGINTARQICGKMVNVHLASQWWRYFKNVTLFHRNGILKSRKWSIFKKGDYKKKDKTGEIVNYFKNNTSIQMCFDKMKQS